jgi:N6-adenosine-specific RNA methylase IME4
MSRRPIPFDVVVADPPWFFGDKLPGKTRGAVRHYEMMTIEELKQYLDGIGVDDGGIADDAVLFLWKVAAIPEWQLVCEAWGFKPVAELVWVKTTGVVQTQISSIEVNCVCVTGGFTRIAFGMGRKVRNCHEVCVIAQRGKPPQPADKSIRSVFFAPVREHSRKPDEFYRIVERLYPQANRLELFSRQDRPGWTCVGNEKGMFK